MELVPFGQSIPEWNLGSRLRYVFDLSSYRSCRAGFQEVSFEVRKILQRILSLGSLQNSTRNLLRLSFENLLFRLAPSNWMLMQLVTGFPEDGCFINAKGNVDGKLV